MLVVFVLFELLVEPAPRVFAESAGKARFQFPVGARHKAADALFALHYDSQCRRLHAADGGEVKAAGLGVEGGHGAGAVDADQPVAFRAAEGGVTQAGHFRGFAQRQKAVADRALGHGLQPQSAHWLLRATVLGDVIKDQFALASSVTGVDQAFDVLALDQAGQQFQAVFGFLDGLQGEVRRDHRQMRERPFAALDLILLRHGQLQQVADGGRQQVMLGLEKLFFFSEATQGASDVLSDRGLLGDDELFGHRRLAR